MWWWSGTPNHDPPISHEAEITILYSLRLAISRKPPRPIVSKCRSARSFARSTGAVAESHPKRPPSGQTKTPRSSSSRSRPWCFLASRTRKVHDQRQTFGNLSAHTHTRKHHVPAAGPPPTSSRRSTMGQRIPLPRVLNDLIRKASSHSTARRISLAARACVERKRPSRAGSHTLRWDTDEDDCRGLPR